jgi:hypothetical protein
MRIRLIRPDFESISGCRRVHCYQHPYRPKWLILALVSQPHGGTVRSVAEDSLDDGGVLG